MTRTLVWFRDDLRVEDHPALSAAADAAGRADDVVGLYVLDDHTDGVRPLGGASRWWLHHALESLRAALGQRGVPLIVRVGSPAELVPELAAELRTERVHWSRRYGPGERALDAAIKKDLPARGIEAESFPGTLLHEPWKVQTNTGGPYKVFTPFYRALTSSTIREPGPGADLLPEQDDPSSSAAVSASGSATPPTSTCSPPAPTGGGLRRAWDPTIDGAHRRLREFVDSLAEGYADGRDVPSSDSTSRLSPYLRFGQLSPFQVWAAASDIPDEKSRRAFRSEIGWREFCWHLLFHFPDLPEKNLRSQFDAYPWQSASDELETFEAWTAGRTGFPLWTPVSGSYGTSATCTIGSAWPRPACSSRTWESTGATARPGSGTRWWTLTQPRTPPTGSGW